MTIILCVLGIIVGIFILRIVAGIIYAVLSFYSLKRDAMREDKEKPEQLSKWDERLKQMREAKQKQQENEKTNR